MRHRLYTNIRMDGFTPLGWLLTTKISPEIKDPPSPKNLDLSFCLAGKSQFFHRFLSKKKTPIKGPKFSTSRKSSQKFELVNRTVNQIGNLVNRILDL